MKKTIIFGVIVGIIITATGCSQTKPSQAQPSQEVSAQVDDRQQEQVEALQTGIREYAHGTLSYEEVLALKEGLSEEVVSNFLIELEALHQSKEHYNSGKASYDQVHMEQSYYAFQKVIEEDQANYDESRRLMEIIRASYIDNVESLIDGYFYDKVPAILDKTEQIFGQDYVTTTSDRMNQLKKEMVLYTGDVRHIFFHSLIVFTELAFDGDGMENGYNYWMTTVSEFKKMLIEMHKRDFVLVDIEDLYTLEEKDGKRVVQKKDLYLPKGKKPFILSLDDLNYYEYMETDGFADRLVLDEDGQVATLTKLPDGGTLIARDNDCVPILDVYLEEHPDFSYRGAKGIIGITGYEGILGYRTDEPSSPTYEQDMEDALAVVRRLKETRWRFASHSYGHINFQKQSLGRVKRDSNKWDKEVGSLIGDTNLFIYPYGAGVKTTDPKFKELRNHGFDIFFGVCAYTELRYIGDSLLMDRCNLDGFRMLKAPYQLEDLFQVGDVIDAARPPLR